MSVYDSNQSNTFKESAATEKARKAVIIMCRRGFREQGLIVHKLLEEVPATFPDKKFHADFGILLSSKDYETQYFFLIEIDGKVGHGTTPTRMKEEYRGSLFETTLGAMTIRIPLSDLTSIQYLHQLDSYFIANIWMPFFDVYLNDDYNIKPINNVLRNFNKQTSYVLANNVVGTRCLTLGCHHLLNDHDLTGCDYRFTDNEKLKCECNTPFLRSDK